MIASDKKVIASLYLKGDDLDPAEITKVLRLMPTESQTRGEVHRTLSGREFVTQTGLWGLVIDRDPAEVTDVVMELLANLSGQSTLGDLPNVQEAYFDIFVAGSLDEGSEGTCEMELTAAQMMALAQYGLPVRFTVSWGGRSCQLSCGETTWKQHGFYVPSDVRYECKLGDVTYRLNTTQRAKSDSDTRNATSPIRLNLTRNGDEIIKDVWLDDSSGGPAVSSVTIFEPTAGSESGDTVICAWPEPTPTTGPYRDVCAPVSLFSPTMPVTQEKMETYLRRYLQK